MPKLEAFEAEEKCIAKSLNYQSSLKNMEGTSTESAKQLERHDSDLVAMTSKITELET